MDEFNEGSYVLLTCAIVGMFIPVLIIAFYTKEQEQDIYDHIYNTAVTVHPNIKDYELAPYIRTIIWNELGNNITSNENLNLVNVPSNKIYSIRLDIKNMSNKKRVLTKLGIFTDKFSTEFVDIMLKVAVTLGAEFNCSYVYTQSDEITLIVIPPDISSSPRYEHIYRGRVNKLLSLSSSLASSTATSEITKIIINKNLKVDQEDYPTIEFDSRLAVWDNVSEAFELILWRAYDCGVNGVSDAVFNIDKKLVGLSTIKKLDYLQSNNKLPLHDHQAYGTIFVKTMCDKVVVNPITKEEVTVARSVLVKQPPGNIINKVKNNKIVF